MKIKWFILHESNWNFENLFLSIITLILKNNCLEKNLLTYSCIRTLLPLGTFPTDKNCYYSYLLIWEEMDCSYMRIHVLLTTRCLPFDLSRQTCNTHLVIFFIWFFICRIFWCRCRCIWSTHCYFTNHSGMINTIVIEFSRSIKCQAIVLVRYYSIRIKKDSFI